MRCDCRHRSQRDPEALGLSRTNGLRKPAPLSCRIWFAPNHPIDTTHGMATRRPSVPFLKLTGEHRKTHAGPFLAVLLSQCALVYLNTLARVQNNTARRGGAIAIDIERLRCDQADKGVVFGVLVMSGANRSAASSPSRRSTTAPNLSRDSHAALSHPTRMCVLPGFARLRDLIAVRVDEPFREFDGQGSDALQARERKRWSAWRTHCASRVRSWDPTI